MEKEIITSRYDYSKEIWIFKSDILGTVAKWCIRQSPYDFPENLLIILATLSGIIGNQFENGTVGMIKYDGTTLIRDLKMWLEQIPEFTALNDRKNGNRALYKAVTRYDGKVGDPDDDFIDLDALYRNVTNDIISEL